MLCVMPFGWYGWRVRPDWGTSFREYALVTATWKVYSVIIFGVLFVKEAAMLITESPVGDLETLNAIVTWPPWMTMLLAVGRLWTNLGQLFRYWETSRCRHPLRLINSGKGAMRYFRSRVSVKP